TKCDQKGEIVQCMPHQVPLVTDPLCALENHIHLNPANEQDHLFIWCHPTMGMHPLSKAEVFKKLTMIAKTHKEIPSLKGHSLWIRGTLFYLLKGVPFDIVKTMGRWTGDSFTLYLCHHALILAPFLQMEPTILDKFKHYMLPQVH
ncbi:hypothetical protein M404DRAFT_158605, partial [Pisolithus tinctorius Marx 270]